MAETKKKFIFFTHALCKSAEFKFSLLQHNLKAQICSFFMCRLNKFCSKIEITVKKMLHNISKVNIQLDVMKL